MTDASIPVIEKESRSWINPDKSAKDENGKKIDRRIQRGVLRSELEYTVDVLREEQKTLISFISDKEQKKQQIFRFQLAAMALLAAALLSALPIYERFVSQLSPVLNENFSDKIFLVMMVFNVLGFIVIAMINLTSVAVTRQITSLKSNIILAVRQLNCNRESIQDAIAARLCGAYPLGNWRNLKNGTQWEPANTIYIRHNKFPIDNSGLQNSLMKRHRNWMIRFVSLIFYPILRIYRKRCVDVNCTNHSVNGKYFDPFSGAKCFCIRDSFKSKEWKHYSFDKYHDVKITKEDKLPRNLILRVLLFGYRAAYTRSADMMSIVTMIVITTLIALLIPAGNFYLWYRINIIPAASGIEENVKVAMENILNYTYLFSAIDVVIILMFIFHFIGIIDMAMNKSVSLLLKEPNEKYVGKKITVS